MGGRSSTAAELEHRARHSAVLDGSVRAGLVAYGFLHLLLAWVAVRLVVDHAGASSGSGAATGQGALAQLAGDGLGRVLLAVMAVMFAGMALWQLVAALVGYRQDDGWQRLVMRIGALARAATYAYFAFASGRLALQGPPGGGQSPESTTARVMQAPAGVVLLVLVGLVVAGSGIVLAVFGVRKGFVEQLDQQARASGRRVPIVVLGQVGYVTKGIAFVLVGGLIAFAALTRDAGRTGGLDQSLYEVMGHTWGGVAVIVAGAGIGCFALFLFARARHLAQDTLTA